MSTGDLIFEERYREALQEFLETNSEEALEQAYSIGRHFISSGRGVVELTTIHQRAVSELEQRHQYQQHDFVRHSRLISQFLTEAVSPFEMVLRGYQEANQNLRDLTDSLEERIEERSRQLSDTRKKYQRLVEQLPGIFYTLRFGRRPHLQFVSPQVEELLGYTQSDWSHLRWGEQVHPDDREEVFEAWRCALQHGESYELEYRIRTRDDRTIWLRDEGTCVELLDGDSADLYGIAIDITERRRLEKQFLSAQKMDAVGRLAAGVAHEFKNVIAVVQAYGQIVLRELPPDSQLVDDIEEILEAGRRADDLTRQMLGFARQSAPQPQNLEINKVVDSLRGMFERLFPDSQQIQFEPSSDRLSVYADRKHIEQILLNLMLNARDATATTDEVVVGTELLDGAELKPSAKLSGREGMESACVYVQDSGTGIDEEIRHRLFEPFVTTKPRGRGTGLGLATSRELARANDGDIIVESQPGEGACFRVLFPHTSTGDRISHPSPFRSIPTLSGNVDANILVVEDESSFRRVLARQLKAVDYTVWTARSLAEAREITGRNNGELDVLITDVVLPDGSGFFLAEELGEEIHGLTTIFMSAYPDDTLAGQTSDDPLRYNVMEKPFDIDEIVELIERVSSMAWPQ